MPEIARRNALFVASNLGYTASNVEFRKGIAEALPVKDTSIDLIISNCVINLAPNKRKVLREMYRVLKPGRRSAISDIVSNQPDTVIWSMTQKNGGNYLSGALQVSDCMAGMVDAGFLGVHQMKFVPWQTIDGLHFPSLTLAGSKLSDMRQREGCSLPHCEVPLGLRSMSSDTPMSEEDRTR